MTKLKYIYSIALLTASLLISCSNGDNTAVIIDENGNPTEGDTSQNKKPTGSSANDLLGENTFTKIVVEIVYVVGFKPTTTTINSFKSFLQNRLHKSDGIQIIQREIDVPASSTHSVNDIIALETTHRTKYNNNNEIAVFAFFANGEYAGNSDNSSVLGIAYRNTSFVIFEETIRDYTSGVLAPDLSVLETTVINHEFGHILGLVNTGSTPQSDHQDTAHGKHCNVDDCLMYWTAETGEGIINMISGGTVPSLDSACLADIQANGGK
jgi:hypothetical protein